MLQFTDRAPITGTERTPEGYLKTVARSVRTGIQLYAGSEVGRPDLPVVRVFRPASEVHSVDSLRSFSHAPVTLGHPTEAVNSDNWGKLAKGEVSTAAKVDSDGWVQLPLIVKGSDAIEAIDSGTRELSAGYTCELIWGDGVSPEGEEFDATQTKINVNHLAIVPRARAGSEARIGDGAAINWGVSPIHATDTEFKSMTLKTVMVDGIGSVETTDAGALVINKLIADAATAKTAQDAAIKALEGKLATADGAVAKAEAERDAALAKVLDDAAIDARVAARGDLVARVKVLAPSVVADGKSDLDVKRAVLADRKINLDGKSDAYVEARFDTLVEDHAGADKTVDALTNREQQVSDAAAEEAALAAANDFNAWRAA